MFECIQLVFCSVDWSKEYIVLKFLRNCELAETTNVRYCDTQSNKHRLIPGANPPAAQSSEREIKNC